MDTSKELINDLERLIRKTLKEGGYKSNLTDDDIKSLCERLELNISDIVTILAGLIRDKNYKLIQFEGKLYELKRENNHLEERINNAAAEEIKLKNGSMIKRVNGRTRQQLKVSMGVPIAQKKTGKGSIMDVYLAKQCGLSDEQIMREYNISRSTLWRRKKEIQQYINQRKQH